VSKLPPGILAVTDRSQTSRPLVDLARAALEAGFVAVMLREKDLPGGPLYELAISMEALCRSAGRPLLVNDRLDVALAIPGVGAHVGAHGLPVPEARRLLGPDRHLGFSAHTVDEARSALLDGADYVTLSPIFSSRSKPDLEPCGVSFLEDAVGRLPSAHVVALGGIDASKLAAVRRAGAQGAAVMGALMRADDPQAAARALVSAWNAALPDLPG
jgi:thiamine-phosphate pyrophosphorylase